MWTFLDLRFNLNEQTYEPYRKPNNEPVYVNIRSNHPSNIITDIPKAIPKRFTNISFNKNVFDRNAALKNNGFDGKITYNDQSEQAYNVNIEEANQATERKRAVIWHNPPPSLPPPPPPTLKLATVASLIWDL